MSTRFTKMLKIALVDNGDDDMVEVLPFQPYQFWFPKLINSYQRDFKNFASALNDYQSSLVSR